MTTRFEIQDMVLEQKAEGATHVLIVCDTFDYSNYPVPVMPEQDVNKIVGAYREKSRDPNSFTKLMEVYSLTGKHSLNVQLAEARAYHLD